MSEGRTAAGAARRVGSGTTRLVRAWKALPNESRLAAYASGALFFTLFLPWYQVHADRAGEGREAAVGERLDHRLGRVLVRRGRGPARRRRRAHASVPARRGPGVPPARRRRRRDHRGRAVDLPADRLADLRQAGRDHHRTVGHHVRDRMGHLRRAGGRGVPRLRRLAHPRRPPARAAAARRGHGAGRIERGRRPRRPGSTPRDAASSAGRRARARPGRAEGRRPEPPPAAGTARPPPRRPAEPQAGARPRRRPAADCRVAPVPSRRSPARGRTTAARRPATPSRHRSPAVGRATRSDARPPAPATLRRRAVRTRRRPTTRRRCRSGESSRRTWTRPSDAATPRPDEPREPETPPDEQLTMRLGSDDDTLRLDRD